MKKPEISATTWRRVLRAAVTLAVIVAVLAANMGLSALAASANLFIDTTSEGRYSVRPRMLEILRAANIEGNVDILFCADRDRLMESSDMTMIYLLATELAAELSFLRVYCVSLEREPEAFDAYRRTSATAIRADDVIVRSGTEFRVYHSDAFFTRASEDNEVLGFNGEQKLCEAILSLTAKDLPLCCFTVDRTAVAAGNYNTSLGTLPRQGDDETGYFYDLLRDAGFTVVGVDLRTEDIPASCTLLILNAPRADYESGRLSDLSYDSPLTKIDRFLDRFGSVLYIRDEEGPSLPHLEEFLAEWGVGFSVRAPGGASYAGTRVTDTKRALSGDPSVVSGVYGDSDAFSDIASLSSPPKAAFENAAGMEIRWADGSSSLNSAGRTVKTLFSTSSSAEAVAAGGAVKKGTFPLFTMTSETRVVDSTYMTANLLVLSTSRYTSAAYLSENVYANGEVLRSLLRGVGRTVVSVADELEFKFYTDTAFTEDADATDNTIYKTDENGKVIWATNPDGTSYKVVLRVIRPLSEGERTAWTVVLVLVPVLLLAGASLFVWLRRRAR